MIDKTQTVGCLHSTLETSINEIMTANPSPNK